MDFIYVLLLAGLYALSQALVWAFARFGEGG
jgi:hypothetical protein